MSLNPQASTRTDANNQCETCASPLVLVADESTMLGTLECPECCCESHFEDLFDIEINQFPNGKGLFLNTPLYKDICGEMILSRQAIYRLDGASQLCCEFLIEQLEKRKELVRNNARWRSYGTKCKDRHSHFRRCGDGSWNMYAHYTSPFVSFVFRVLPGSLEASDLIHYFQVVIPVIGQKLEQFEATKR